MTRLYGITPAQREFGSKGLNTERNPDERIVILREHFTGLDQFGFGGEHSFKPIGSFADWFEAAKGTRKTFSPSLLRGEGRF